MHFSSRGWKKEKVLLSHDECEAKILSLLNDENNPHNELWCRLKTTSPTTIPDGVKNFEPKYPIIKSKVFEGLVTMLKALQAEDRGLTNKIRKNNTNAHKTSITLPDADNMIYTIIQRPAPGKTINVFDGWRLCRIFVKTKEEHKAKTDQWKAATAANKANGTSNAKRSKADRKRMATASTFKDAVESDRKKARTGA